MNGDQLLRYPRHILFDEIGIEERTRLFESHALVISAGGLGTVALSYLAAAGVGTLTIVDDGTVDLTNLQCQIIRTTESVGQLEVASAQAVIARLNPDVYVYAVQRRLDADAAGARLNGVSVVLGYSDNLGTCQITNLARVWTGAPLVSGAATRFDGQISVFDSRAGSPCYIYLFPPDEPMPDVTCAAMSVFSSLVGMVGTMQATEALKLIAGIDSSPVGRLLMLDGSTIEWTVMRIVRQPFHPVCKGMY